MTLLSFVVSWFSFDAEWDAECTHTHILTGRFFRLLFQGVSTCFSPFNKVFAHPNTAIIMDLSMLKGTIVRREMIYEVYERD